MDQEGCNELKRIQFDQWVSWSLAFLTICGVPKLLAGGKSLRCAWKVRDCRCDTVFI